MWSKFTSFTFITLALLQTVITSGYTNSTRNNGIYEERKPCDFQSASGRVGLSTIELLSRDGYPSETHSVVSEDGYVTELHRIPGPGKPAVLLMPGILQSSRDFLMNCYDRALPYKLFNAGFDVWIGNYRGNTYARNHTHLSPKQRQFWEFDTEDIMRFDGPRFIDYILEATGKRKLTWIGFSLGNTVMFGMLSLKPEYNDKLHAGIVLGNAVYFNSSTNRGLKVLARNKNTVEAFAKSLWRGEIIPSSLAKILGRTAPEACIAEATSPSLCSWAFRLLGLFNPFQINQPYLPQIVSVFPSPTGYKVIGQWFQWINSGEFTAYDKERHSWRDAGWRANSLRKYNLTDSTLPILNFWSSTDFITSEPDVMRAVRQLPNVVANIKVPFQTWGHIDYIYAKDADIYVYDRILEFLRNKDLN